MDSIVSKRYAKALVNSIDIKEINEILEIFKILSRCFEDIAFKTIINSPAIKKNKKDNFILSITNIKNSKVINLIKLLNHKNRLNEIPHIYNELKKFINSNNNEYELTILSSFKIDSKEQIKNKLSRKLNLSLYINHQYMEMEGIKLFVDGIGIETSFLKSKFSNNLKKHILKAF